MDFDTTQVLTLFVSILFPVLVGYVTKASWDSGLKAVILAAVSAVSGVLSSALDPTHSFHWQAALLTAVGAFAIAVATHFGLWKPTGVSAAVQARGVKDDYGRAA